MASSPKPASQNRRPVFQVHRSDPPGGALRAREEPYHDAVVDALKADGWTITDDPLTLTVGDRDLFVDLAAERPVIGAEKGSEKIAVEVQSFLNPSAVRNL